MPKVIKRARKRRRKWPLLVAGGVPLTLLLIVIFVNSSGNDYVYREGSNLPDKSVAVVFGAGLIANGKPSMILKSRLDGAISLYKRHKVYKLLMSGDNQVRYHNEPEAMRRYAVEHGVSNTNIVLDYAGRDTYDTCFRAKSVFGVKSAVLVTQAYHAPRAVFIGRALGIDAVALAVPNLDQYPATQAAYTSREYLADLKAWWDVEISHRQPYVSQMK